MINCLADLSTINIFDHHCKVLQARNVKNSITSVIFFLYSMHTLDLLMAFCASLVQKALPRFLLRLFTTCFPLTC